MYIMPAFTNGVSLSFPLSSLQNGRNTSPNQFLVIDPKELYEACHYSMLKANFSRFFCFVMILRYDVMSRLSQR